MTFDPHGRDAMQVGQAGEHLVCFDLLLQGLRVSVSAAGLPYDIIAGDEERLYRVQVKTTAALPRDIGKTRLVYRFGMRHAKGARKRYEADSVDVFAFAFLDRRLVAYLPIGSCVSRDGSTKQTIDWRPRGTTPERDLRGRRWCGRTIRAIEDHAGFPHG